MAELAARNAAARKISAALSSSSSDSGDRRNGDGDEEYFGEVSNSQDGRSQGQKGKDLEEEFPPSVTASEDASGTTTDPWRDGDSYTSPLDGDGKAQAGGG